MRSSKRKTAIRFSLGTDFTECTYIYIIYIYIYLTGYQAYEAYAQLIFTLFHSLKGGWREALDALGCGFSSSAGNNGHGQRPETNNDDIDMAHLSFFMQHMGDCNRCVFTCLNHSRSDSLGWDFDM